MVNPFAEFLSCRPRRRTLPLDHIIAVRDARLEQLMAGYTAYIAQTELDWGRMPDRHLIEQAYQAALGCVAGLVYDPEDIEDFCFSLEQLHTPTTAHALPQDAPGLWGLTGLYLSALCNQTTGSRLQLRLQWMPARLHLLGYKLPAGKRLSIEGLCGDWLGMALAGGEIHLQGSAFSGLGYGLQQGRITVSDNAGADVGQGMVGGEIHVLRGRIRGIGHVYGGSVYLGPRRVAPTEPDEHRATATPERPPA